MSGDPEISVELRHSVQLTIFIGLGVILIAVFLKWIRKDDRSSSSSSKNDKPEKQKSSSGESSSKHGKKEQASSVKTSSKKKLTERENRRNMRTNEKGLTPPWLVGACKGHNGNVSDMDIAANSKFLVSCCDEDGATKPTDQSTTIAESGKDNSSASSQSTSPNLSKSLSRRQKKNRKIVKEHQTRPTKPPKSSPNASPAKQPDENYEPLVEYTKINLPVDFLVRLLRNYCLDQESMSTLGYPFKKPKLPVGQTNSAPVKSYSLDVHAEEFVPRKDIERDSGNGSVSGNSSEEETSSTNSDVSPTNSQSALTPGTIKMKDRQYRLCVRCGKYFYVSSKEYITRETCRYHWGKLELNCKGYGPMAYSCCNCQRGSVGCSLGKLHVSVGPPKLFVNSTFVETEPPKKRRKSRNYGVYSLDCEMSYTIAGLEAVKVTLVDMTGRAVYDEFVQPKNKIIDFNTRFSGIDEELFNKSNPKKLVQVQRDLKKFISSETIVIGHGLENDFKALRMVHKTVVDTAYTFPHNRGLPFKRSLKSITKSFLKRDIQCSDNGHDSVEDARACMELMLYRVRLDYNL